MHGLTQTPLKQVVPSGHGGGESATPSQSLSRLSQISIPGFTAPSHWNLPPTQLSVPALQGSLSCGDTGRSHASPIFGSFGVQQPGVAL